MVRRKNSPLYDSFLLCRNSIRKDLSHIAHKRRNARFNGLWWVNTPPQPLNAHTAAHAAKQGAFRMGRYLYPRAVLRGLETLRGRVSERRTLPLFGFGRGRSRRTRRAFGTAMRSCASLFRGVAAPLGCVILLLFPLPHRWVSRFWSTVITECREKHTSLLCTELLCQLCLHLPPLCCTL